MLFQGKKKNDIRMSFSFEKVFLLMGYSKKLYNVLGGYAYYNSISLI